MLLFCFGAMSEFTCSDSASEQADVLAIGYAP